MLSPVVDGSVCGYRDKDMAVCERWGRIAGGGVLAPVGMIDMFLGLKQWLKIGVLVPKATPLF